MFHSQRCTPAVLSVNSFVRASGGPTLLSPANATRTSARSTGTDERAQVKIHMASPLAPLPGTGLEDMKQQFKKTKKRSSVLYSGAFWSALGHFEARRVLLLLICRFFLSLCLRLQSVISLPGGETAEREVHAEARKRPRWLLCSSRTLLTRETNILQCANNEACVPSASRTPFNKQLRHHL